MSPTARALLTLELIQNSPGITALRIGERLGVTERASRRYIAILREADIPIESLSGPHGGYRVGRGLRLPPMIFTAAEALGLVMAVLEGHKDAADPEDLVGGALAKIMRGLPAYTGIRPLPLEPRRPDGRSPDPAVTETLIGACGAAHRLRLTYRGREDAQFEMAVDPWAVVLRHSRWYLICWSHRRDAMRVLRLDKIVRVGTLPETFAPPADLDPLRTLEEHLSQGWQHPVDVLVEASVEEAVTWLPRSLGRLKSDGKLARLTATTSNVHWYARQLSTIPAPFRVLGGEALRDATAELAASLAGALDPPQ